MWCAKKYKKSGFTLVELMVTVTIIGILLAVALPSYQDYVKQGRRAEAQQYLLQQAHVLERQYTRTGGYPENFNLSTTQYYSFPYTTSGGNTNFTLKAEPQGSQSDDECGTLSINQSGNTTPDNCW